MIAPLIRLVHDPIDAAAVRTFVAGSAALGGIVFFEGATRGEHHAEHGALVHLEYEAYDDMAVRELAALAEEAGRKWQAGRVAIVHRLGKVPPGEASVMIAVACPHRAEAFDACRWLIDTLKRDIPIWKADVYADGWRRWVDPGIRQTGD